jgi:hypothetical protein
MLAPETNLAWHRAHRIARDASESERGEWHLGHAANCGCHSLDPLPRAMKRSSTGKTPQRAGAARARATATKSVRAAPSLREARATLDNLEEGFDEAALHLLRLPQYKGWSSGPVVPLRAAELGPGELGWSRRLESPTGAATVELRLFPGRKEASRSSGTSRAVPGKGKTVSKSLPGSPPGVLTARSEAPRADPKLSRFLAELAEELQTDDEE